MRKLLCFLLTAVLVSALMLPVQAAENGFKMADITVQEAQTVYIPVSLQSEITATAMGLTYTYDRAVLQVVPEECKWISKGTLRDFSKTADQAVWAAKDPQKLSGDLCVLAFRIRNPQNFTETTVSCSLVVENGDASVGTYQASSRITKVCEHLFGDWTDKGLQGHVRGCEQCGAEEFQSHDWDAGTKSADPQKPNVTIFTRQCKICGAERIEEISGGTQEILPTYPEMTAPTAPEDSLRDPEATKPQPTYPEDISPANPTEPNAGGSNGTKPPAGGSSANTGGSQQGQGSKGPNTVPQPMDYNAAPKTEETKPQEAAYKPEGNAESGTAASVSKDVPQAGPKDHPMAIKINPVEGTAAEDEAVSTAVEADDRSAVIWPTAAAVLTVCAAGAVWVIRKKRK